MTSQTPPAIDFGQLTVEKKAKRHWEHPTVIEIVKVKLGVSLEPTVPALSWRSWDEDMDEMHQFSVTLFDKNGAVRPHLVESDYRSGTGCFGREMNFGELVYILDIKVNESHRGKGVGTWALLQFLGSEHVQSDDTVVCWPSPVGIHDKSAWNAAGNRQIAFFRKNHFRRIGRTGFFGYSPNPDHPSRSISVDADVGAIDDDFQEPTSNNPEERQLRFPLHCAIANDKTANIAVIIQSFYDQDPRSIHKVDDVGLTPISVAVAAKNLVATRKLLEWDLCADLNNAANRDGVTPLEQLADNRPWVNLFMQISKNIFPRGNMVVPFKRWDLSAYILPVDAAFWKDSMPMNFMMFTKGQPADPPSYCNVFDAIYLLLSTTEDMLSAAAVLPFITTDRSSQFYFQKGGRIEYAFDSITHCAQAQSPLGDNTFSETFDEDYEAWASLPTCANDLEFKMVRSKIGLGIPGQRWGPYNDFGDDGMDVGGGLDSEEGEDSDSDF
ncbi:ankyrin repeat family protein [Mycena maculata]|uniref:Ankyrin repeat family protein n=1 Tax=Mycena maculata TaxID=230809 RepID=A0AAD7HXR5_9AGAR|nr:ankyrin repeat family protein [Mycena maculata]